MKQNKETLKQFFETGDKPTQQQYADLIDSYIDSKQEAGEANRRFVIDETGEVSVASEQLIPEYTLSPISGTNTVDLLKDGVSVSQIDLTPYLDNTNLARLVSGTVDSNGLATFTRDDNSTFTVDFSGLVGSSGNQAQVDWNQTDPNQVDFIKNKPEIFLENNFAVVKAGNISHTPEIGSFDNYYNNLDDVLSAIDQPKYHNSNFKIIIQSTGTFTISNPHNNIQGLEIYSDYACNIKLENQAFSATNCKIDMKYGEIQATRYASFYIWKNAYLKLKSVKVLDEGVPVNSGLSLYPVNFVNSSVDLASIYMDVNEFYVDTTIGQSGYVFYPAQEKYDKIDVKIDTIFYKKNGGASYIDCFTNLRRGVQKNLYCKIDVGEIDLTDCTDGLMQVFNGLGTTTSNVKTNNFDSTGYFDLSIGSIKNPNQISVFLFSNTRNSNIKMFFKDSFIEGNNNLLLRNNGELGCNSRIIFSGKLKTNSSTYLCYLASWSVEKPDYDTVEVFLKELEWINEGTGKLFYTRLYDNENSVTPKVDPRIKIKDCHFKANGMLGTIGDTTGNNSPITDSSVLFFGENRIDVNGETYLLERPENGINHSQAPNAVVNYGKIFHNGVNADYPDSRSIKEKELKFTHKL